MTENRAEYRPAAASCGRCRASLGLASVKASDGVWYCSSACSTGSAAPDQVTVKLPEEELYSVPRRYMKRRGAKELKGTRPGN